MERVIEDLWQGGSASAGGTSRYVWRDLREFGTNPGNLGAKLFATRAGRTRRPLVVALHGCTQPVDIFAQASGWARLALSHDFLLLMPAQRRENNIKTCFSWYDPKNTRRDSGEASSIRQMIAEVCSAHAVDETRIFICGLSAGGAMAGAMLALYPEVFAAGAVIAGLPFGTAASVTEAIESMRSGRVRDARVWGDLVRQAAPSGTTRWPAISIWHGTQDAVVKPINAGELVKQWTNVHGVGAEVPSETHIGRAVQRTWLDGRGRACVLEYEVPGLGHGAAVDDVDPPAPFFLPAGLSSAQTIATDWGLLSRRRRSMDVLAGLFSSA